MSRTSRNIVGLLFILLGGISIAEHVFNVNIFMRFHLWPLYVLIPGLCFEYGYFSTKRAPGVLVPGGILTTLGLLFLFESNTNFRFSAYTWPVYILAPAVGLFQLYFFGERNKGLLIPAGILTTVATVCFATIFLGKIFSFINYSLVGPVVLVVVGIMILAGRKDELADEYDKKKYE